MKKIKLFRITTTTITIDVLLKNQLKFLSSFFNVTIISDCSLNLSKIAIRENVGYHEIKMFRNISIYNDFKSLIKFFILFIKSRPNIVHSNTPKSSLLSMTAGAFAFVKFRIYQVTGLRYETSSGITRFVLILFERITCFFATHIVAESVGVRRMLIADKITSKKIFIIGNGNLNGIDTDYWKPSNIGLLDCENLIKEFNIVSDDYVFIFVGRVVRDKGVNELAYAFDKLSRVYSRAKLIILGDKEDSFDPINKSVNDILISNKNIFLVPFKNDIRPYLCISNCLVLPSYREGFPNVILQAGSFGLPVIMTPVNGYDEYLNSWNGHIIYKRDVKNLYDVLLMHCSLQKKYDSSRISDFVIDNFSQKKLYPELLKFYNSLN